jgi:hypothetical protein
VRKFFQIFGAVALIIFLPLGVGIGWTVPQAIRPDSESKAFVDAAVPAITATWSTREIPNRANPEFRVATKSEQPETLVRQFWPARAAKDDSSVSQATVTYFTSTGSKTMATSGANAEYEDGAAKITPLPHGWETSGS